MTRPPLALLSALSLATLVAGAPMVAQTGAPPAVTVNDLQRYTPNQLDNLVGPIALYPDALLAQVLVAATFPDQVQEAARFVRANGTASIDEQAWDVSVKAVAHYASALNMMDEKADWTGTLGRAYANQSSEVMAAVQRMRAMADQQGNLVSTAQQQVVRESGSYVIVPAQPRVIYVPVYDPVVIYTRPVFSMGFGSRYWSFGVGFPIGGWLSYDCDWLAQRVYYNGWSDSYFSYGGGWRARSRPFVVITSTYVSSRYRSVYLNRDNRRRPVDYRNVDRYAGVHRDTYFDDRRGGSRDGRDRDGGYRARDNDRARPDAGYSGRTPQPRDSRPRVAAPERRRNDPPRSEGRREPPPQQPQPRQARPPQQERARQAPARPDGERRTAEPRGARGSGAGNRRPLGE